MTRSDEDLIEAARHDVATFGRVFEVYQLPIYRYLRSLGNSDADAADIAATTFERAFRGLSDYRPVGSSAGWLFRIARNAAIDAARRRRPHTPLEAVSPGRLPVEERSPETELLRAERATELAGLVRALPEAQRDAVALRYSAGLSARQIAPIIGKSEAATQKLLTRALTALKKAYDGQA